MSQTECSPSESSTSLSASLPPPTRPPISRSAHVGLDAVAPERPQSDISSPYHVQPPLPAPGEPTSRPGSVPPKQSPSLAPPPEEEKGYLLTGLPLPNTLEPEDAATIASAFAAETCSVLKAEAFIAERRYRQMIMAAQSFKLHVLRTRLKYEKAIRDTTKLRAAAHGVLRTTHDVYPVWDTLPNSDCPADEILHGIDLD